MSIVVKDLSFTYSKGSQFEKKALDGVSITVEDGDFLAIVGHTGSGKSTFLQHLNGLIKLTEGEIKVLDIDLTVRKPDYRKLRFSVGMVFQYPEYQLFDETVAKDVGFGPRNMKLDGEEIDRRVREVVSLVGLDYDEIAEKSPFELSGGQKRRVAIAGVLAMRPQILVLDEPTAGLDPLGKREIMKLVLKLKESMCPTVIMVTHDMDIVAAYATRAAVFQSGKIVFDGKPYELFAKDDLKEYGLDVPAAVGIANELRKVGFDIPKEAITPEAIVDYLTGKRGEND